MITNSIPAIPTFFDGVLFKSRNEARWAVLLKYMKIEKEYEPEGFFVPEPYLIDFYFPNIGDQEDFPCGAFMEVKRGEFSTSEMRKAYRLCQLTGNAVILADGPPKPRPYQMFHKTYPWRKPDLFEISIPGKINNIVHGNWWSLYDLENNLENEEYFRPYNIANSYDFPGHPVRYQLKLI